MRELVQALENSLCKNSGIDTLHFSFTTWLARDMGGAMGKISSTRVRFAETQACLFMSGEEGGQIV